jgi:hypothetical protein
MEDFARNSATQTECIMRGDATTGTEHAMRALAAFKTPYTHGEAGQDELTTLFTHFRIDMRVTAAAFLLEHRTTEARAVLEEAARGEGLAALVAMQPLKNWEDETWALDPA